MPFHSTGRRRTMLLASFVSQASSRPHLSVSTLKTAWWLLAGSGSEGGVGSEDSRLLVFPDKGKTWLAGPTEVSPPHVAGLVPLCVR